MKHQEMRGFTIVEVIITIAVITILGGISVPVYKVFQAKNDLGVAENTVVQTLRRAQVLSQAIKGDMNWGLKVENGKVTIFKGLDYASRDSNADEVFDLPRRVNPSGLTEIVFSKFSGLPETTGAILLSTKDETKEITINEKGTVDY